MSKRKGKYSGVIAGLPQLQEEQGYQARVNAEKDRVRSVNGGGPGALASRYRQLRDRQDRVARVAAQVHLELTATEQLMWASFEANGITSVGLADGGDVNTRQEPYSQVRNAEALREWVLGTPLRSKLALPWQTLNSDVKERLLNGLGLPPGVDVFVRTTTVLTRPKAG